MPYPLLRKTGRGLAVLVLTLAMTSVVFGAEKFEVDQFISPQFCGDCHSEIYGQWENSTHGLAHQDPVYLAAADFFRQGLTDADEIAEAEACVKCHTPVGVATGYPEKTSDDRAKIPEIATFGVQCDYCHSATSASRMYNNGLILEPGQGEYDPGVKRGPRKDAFSSFHETAFSEFHTGPEICGTCHNVKHVVFQTDLETTYDEWLASPYNTDDPASRVTCQDCHMRQRPGIPATASTPRPDNPGFASDLGPERPHVFTHNFVGGNNYMPGLFDGDDQIRMAEERLQNAATLAVKVTEKDRIQVTITNTGAGHKLPTGLSNARQMWLELTVTEKKSGQTVYTAGQPDENGYLAESVRVYRTVFGDGSGTPTENLAKAREILKDDRVPPGASVTQTFCLPEKAPATGLVVTARLCYRTFSQQLIDQIAGQGAHQLPITTMAEVRQEI